MESLNIFESKQSLCEFVKNLCYNPDMIKTLFTTPTDNEEINEFLSLFMRNSEAREFMKHAAHNPIMFASFAESLNEDHPVITQIYESKPPTMLEDNKLTEAYVQYCVKGALKQMEYYSAHKMDIDTLIEAARIPIHLAIDVHQQCDGNLQQCFESLQRLAA